MGHNQTWPLYSITSSARASSVGGMVKPGAFAVLELIHRVFGSQLVGRRPWHRQSLRWVGHPAIGGAALGVFISAGQTAALQGVQQSLMVLFGLPGIGSGKVANRLVERRALAEIS